MYEGQGITMYNVEVVQCGRVEATQAATTPVILATPNSHHCTVKPPTIMGPL